MMVRTRKFLAPVLLALTSMLFTGLAVAQGDLTEGTVRKIDTEQGKITIKHGPIDNLQMPPMTMVFNVRDAAMLDGVEQGDDIVFHVVDEGGRMVIESLERR